jgi:N-sulfoglucosamine sulfohydrolase
MIIRKPGQKPGVINSTMVSFTDVTPTILDWCSVKPEPKGKKAYELPGRSILPVLENPRADGWEKVFASHQFHEITMYYPMRMVRTRNHKYLLNLAHPLEYPSAADVWGSPSWQGILKRNDKFMGKREVRAFLHRPKEEFYDLAKDPNELHNLMLDQKWLADPANQVLVAAHKNWLAEWRKKTNDPWLIKDLHE